MHSALMPIPHIVEKLVGRGELLHPIDVILILGDGFGVHRADDSDILEQRFQGDLVVGTDVFPALGYEHIQIPRPITGSGLGAGGQLIGAVCGIDVFQSGQNVGSDDQIGGGLAAQESQLVCASGNDIERLRRDVALDVGSSGIPLIVGSNNLDPVGFLQSGLPDGVIGECIHHCHRTVVLTTIVDGHDDAIDQPVQFRLSCKTPGITLGCQKLLADFTTDFGGLPILMNLVGLPTPAVADHGVIGGHADFGSHVQNNAVIDACLEQLRINGSGGDGSCENILLGVSLNFDQASDGFRLKIGDGFEIDADSADLRSKIVRHCVHLTFRKILCCPLHYSQT